jgi:hypothetical protein
MNAIIERLGSENILYAQPFNRSAHQVKEVMQQKCTRSVPAVRNVATCITAIAWYLFTRKFTLPAGVISVNPPRNRLPVP